MVRVRLVALATVAATSSLGFMAAPAAYAAVGEGPTALGVDSGSAASATTPGADATAEGAAAPALAAISGAGAAQRATSLAGTSTGTVRVIAGNSRGTAPITGFCAWLVNATTGKSSPQRCTTSNKPFDITGVAAGKYEVWMRATPWRYYARTYRPITVKAGAVTDGSIALNTGAVISGKVVDRASGKPVAGARVEVTRVRGGMEDYVMFTTDKAGRLSAEPQYASGTYRILVTPPAGSKLGAQWVGPKGGVGRSGKAAPILVKTGRTVKMPAIRLDPAGTIKGRITVAAPTTPVPAPQPTPTDSPQPTPVPTTSPTPSESPTATPTAAADQQTSSLAAATAVPDMVSYQESGMHGAGDSVVAKNGVYTFNNLGPYDWSLQVVSARAASQWIGGVPTSAAATGIKVVARKITTANISLVQGVKITGTVGAKTGKKGDRILVAALTANDGGRLQGSYHGNYGQAFTVWVLPNLDVKLYSRVVRPVSKTRGVFITNQWYSHAKSFDDATLVKTPAEGGITINFSK